MTMYFFDAFFHNLPELRRVFIGPVGEFDAAAVLSNHRAKAGPAGNRLPCKHT